LEITYTGASYLFVNKESIESYYYFISFKERKLGSKMFKIVKTFRGLEWFKTTEDRDKVIYENYNGR